MRMMDSPTRASCRKADAFFGENDATTITYGVGPEPEFGFDAVSGPRRPA